MVRIPEIVSHANLLEQIIGQFAFMKAMSEPEDRGFDQLQNVNLNDIYKKADEFFVQLTDEFGLIESEPKQLKQKLFEFLKEWNQIIDVEAIQQNVHYQLQKIAP